MRRNTRRLNPRCGRFIRNLRLLKPIEDHDIEKEAYRKCRKLFEEIQDLAGVYVTTEASIPVLKAAEDAKVLDRLTIITTDLFPDWCRTFDRARW